jgi:hypothetical protein
MKKIGNTALGSLYDSPGASGGGHMIRVAICAATGSVRKAMPFESGIGWILNPDYRPAEIDKQQYHEIS